MTDISNKTLFNEHAETYEESLARSTKWVSNDTGYFAEHKVLQIKHHLRSVPRSILDYGCGIGRNIPPLMRHFPNATHYGCDVSDKSVKVAREHNPQASFFINSEWQGQPRFDLIVVANVFHHVIPAERPGVIAELLRMVSLGGTVFVFEHNPLNPLTRYSVSQCPFDADAQLLWPSELVRLFAAGECRLRRKKYTLFLPQWAGRFGCLEPYLGWCPLGAQYFVQVEQAGSARR